MLDNGDYVNCSEAGGTWAREAAAGDCFHPAAGSYEELAAIVDGSAAWRDWLASTG